MVYIHPELLANPSLVGQPLNHARIAYQSYLTRDNVVGTPSLAGYPVTNVANGATYERYKPSSGVAVVVMDAANQVEVDYVAVLHSGVTNIKIESTVDGTNLVTRANFSVTGSAIMALFAPNSARYWRITLTGVDMQIAKINIGKVLEMQRSLYGGHSPLALNRVTSVKPFVSIGGQFLGASVTRQGLSSRFEWQNLSAAWYREHFDKFAAFIPQANPFFIAWRPKAYPEELAYCLAKSDPAPTNLGRRDLMSVSLDVEGFVNVC